MMPSSGHRKLLNAASTRSGLAIHKMNTASRGKSPPKSAKRQPIASSSLSRCLAASGGGGRHAATCAARPCEIPSSSSPSKLLVMVASCRARRGGGFHGVELFGLGGLQQPDLDQVQGADEPIR